MVLNRFAQRNAVEESFYEEIYREVIDLYGYEVQYIFRDVIESEPGNSNTLNVLNDYLESQFNEAITIPVYIENVDGFEGEGNLLAKFGFELRDSCTFILSQSTWREEYQASNYAHRERNDEDRSDDHLPETPANRRPYEGDLIYLPFSKSFFEIMEVEHEQPFYQVNNLPAYMLRCELFEFNAEEFDTDIEEVDVLNAYDPETDPFAQNKVFDDIENDKTDEGLIDFSESNPFGSQ